jgi:hypothetical protein
MLGHFHAFCSGRSVHARGVVNKCVCVGQFVIYHECVQKCGNVDGGEVSVPTLR